MKTFCKLQTPGYTAQILAFHLPECNRLKKPLKCRPSDISRGRGAVKFTKTHEIPRNSQEILPNTCRHNIFESYHGCWGCLLAVNLLIYLETSSPQRVNNVSNDVKTQAFLA